MFGNTVANSKDETGYQRHSTALPGWGDITGVDAPSDEEERTRGTISTLQFGLVVLLMVGAITLYVRHVRATQQLLADLRKARKVNRDLHLRYLRLQSKYQSATGPAKIYDRARALGLEEGMTYGPTIYLDAKREQ